MYKKVYWDLPGSAEDLSNIPTTSSNRGGAGRQGGNVKFTLQTIRQKEALGEHFPAFGQLHHRQTSSPHSSNPSLSSIAAGTREGNSSHYESGTTSSSSGYAASTGTGGTIYQVYESSGPGTIRITKRQSSYESLGFPPTGSSPEEKGDAPTPTMSIRQRTESPELTYKQLLEAELNKLKQYISQLRSEAVPEQTTALSDIFTSLKSAWSRPQLGRSLAVCLCDTLRTEGALTLMLDSFGDCEVYDLVLGSARVLSQCLTSANRDYLVHQNSGLHVVVTVSSKHKQDIEMLVATTGILESLFKHSESTCASLVSLGTLDLMSFSCRSPNAAVLRNCAMGLANLALYGDTENHEAMLAARIPDWLFPLAFSGDDVVRYYTSLAICALTVSREIAPLIENSGTMALVEPFILKHSPSSFARSAMVHFQGKSDDWLKRLVPMLKSENRQSQALAAFHFAMEAAVKHEQQNLQVLYDVGAVEELKVVASSPNKLAARFACEALNTLGEKLPYTLSAHPPPLWSPTDVQNWVKQVGHEDLADSLFKLAVNGDLLLSLTDQQIKEDLGISNSLTRQRFLTRLIELKQHADYSSCDPTKLCNWLEKVDPSLRQYAYSMLNSGATVDLLPTLTDCHLKEDCLIQNGIHRLKIMQAASSSGPICPPTNYTKPVVDTTNSIPSSPSVNPNNKRIDVFISYRRSTGSQLASLLKVHLQLRGFIVFLDIQELAAGRFDDRLLSSIKQARNFLLVLTPDSLDRCIGDSMGKDWVHREIVAALTNGCNIVPVINDFHWPAQDSLPDDMKAVTKFNGVRWYHEYQEACVDKLEYFLRTGSQSSLSDSAIPEPSTPKDA